MGWGFGPTSFLQRIYPLTTTIRVPAQKPSGPRCLIAFVGEAPSTEELEQGKPLVGPSGKVFNAALRTANLDRAAFWVGNVFDEKLPANDVSNWCSQTKEAREGGWADLPPIGNAGYLRPEHRWHLERLRDELAAVNPTVIVPIGATALWAFTGEVNVGLYRGSAIEAKFIRPGAKLLPTYHPAHIIHQWKLLSILVGDFIKAAAEAERGPKVIYPQRRLYLEPTLKDMREWYGELTSSDLLSVDIETAWGQITCVGFAPDQTKAMCVPFVDFRKPNHSYWADPNDELTAWVWVKAVLEDPVPKLGQNYGGYDAYWLLAKHGIRTMNMAHDTRLLHHALYPELPKDLAFLGASYSQQGPWKTMGNKGAKEKKDD